MPRAFSSGALSIWSYAVNVAPPVSARTFEIAAVSDVLPWSTCPIVPMLQCGFVRSNLPLAMVISPSAISLSELLRDFVRDRLRDLRVVVELHRVGGASLRKGAQLADVAEHV